MKRRRNKAHKYAAIVASNESNNRLISLGKLQYQMLNQRWLGFLAGVLVSGWGSAALTAGSSVS